MSCVSRSSTCTTFYMQSLCMAILYQATMSLVASSLPMSMLLTLAENLFFLSTPSESWTGHGNVYLMCKSSVWVHWFLIVSQRLGSLTMHCVTDCAFRKLHAAWIHMRAGVTIWLDPSGPSGTECASQQKAYQRSDVILQVPCKPKEECYTDDMTGAFHICGGTWTPISLADISTRTAQALETFLHGNNQSQC